MRSQSLTGESTDFSIELGLQEGGSSRYQAEGGLVFYEAGPRSVQTAVRVVGGDETLASALAGDEGARVGELLFCGFGVPYSCSPTALRLGPVPVEDAPPVELIECRRLED